MPVPGMTTLGLILLCSALAVEYTSAAEYRGRNSFEVRVRYSDGEIRHGRYEVEVR